MTHDLDDDLVELEPPFDIEEAIAEIDIEDDDVAQALIGLIRDGLVMTTGERRNGKLVWVAVHSVN